MKPTNKGMTLVEVLVAMLILAGATLALYFSWSGSLANFRKARNYSTVALLLQKRMAEFEAEMRGKTVEEFDQKESEAGDFGENYPDYAWEIKTKPFTIPAIAPPTAPGGGTDMLTETIFKTISEYFEKAVREVSVTVIFKRGERELKYSISTIYVDFSKEISLGQ